MGSLHGEARNGKFAVGNPATNFDLGPHALDGLTFPWTFDWQICSIEDALGDAGIKCQKLDWRWWKKLNVGPMRGPGELLDACLQGGSAHGETRFMKTQGN
jgi:hypothetical protein